MLSIPKKEANLFVKSEVSKKYPWLVIAIIEKHKFPCLPKKDFHKLTQAHQDFLNLIQNDNSIILNRKLADDYKRILEIVETDYEMQLKLRQSKINIKMIESTYSTIQAFLNDLKIYKENCKSKIWGITPEIARWCYKNGSPKLIELIQNFGEINKYTVDQIKEENHLHNVVNQFRNLFEDKKVKIDTNELLNVGRISSQSYDSAINLICRHGNFQQYYNYYYADTSINEIAYIDKNSRRICALDYNLFIQKFKYYIYENKIDMKKNQVLLNYIQKNSTRYEENDYRHHLRQLGIVIK